MLKFLKNWTLPIAMLVGAIGYHSFFLDSGTYFYHVATHFL